MTSGIVEEVGTEVDNLSVGDSVVTSGARLKGEISSVWGGHASMSVNDVTGIVPLPGAVSPQEAALFILPNVGLNAVSIAGINERDCVLIFGQGAKYVGFPLDGVKEIDKGF